MLPIENFLDKMIIYYRNNYINSGVGILVVENDGRVNTIIPAKHNNFNYFVESNFDKFSTDDEVEEFFTDIEIPKQEYMDKHKHIIEIERRHYVRKWKNKNVWNIFLKQKFNRNDSDYKLQLQEEVSCGEYHRNRCDLAGIEYVNGKIHNSIGIEIKQQLGDFKSGCGMNFCFDVNYLCVPSEFVGFTFQYLYEQNLDNVGIIEYRNKPTYYKEDLMLFKKYHVITQEMELKIDQIVLWKRIFIMH